MRTYLINTNFAHGSHVVKALTNRHAVARLVARLGLIEQQTEQVIRWSVKDLTDLPREEWPETAKEMAK